MWPRAPDLPYPGGAYAQGPRGHTYVMYLAHAMGLGGAGCCVLVVTRTNRGQKLRGVSRLDRVCAEGQYAIAISTPTLLGTR